MGWLPASYGNGCASIVLVSSTSHFSFVHRMEAALFSRLKPGQKLVNINSNTIKRPDFFDQIADPCLIVTVGSEALSTVLVTKTQIPILSTLTRKNIFHQLLAQFNRGLHDNEYPISAIYLDQPLARQFDLIKQIFPHKKDREPIGVILGSQSMTEQTALQTLSKEKKMTLTLQYVNKAENPVAVLDAMANEVKCVLAIPDNTIYNPKTSHGILLTSFNKRVPLIGYSRAYVNNGALAALYSTTKQLAQQTADVILTFIDSGKLPSPQYPKEYTLALNHQLIRSLGIKVDKEISHE
jgi:ABC-type uncharacterized transport system substrate-binding protein